MISEDQQDQAALSALGLLDDDERAEFERALAVNPELRALADELRESAASLALAADLETVQPPAELKARLLAKVEGGSSPAALVRNGARGFWTTHVRWGIAVAAALTPFLAFLAGTWQPGEAGWMRDLRQQSELLRMRDRASLLQSKTRQQELTIQRLDNALAQRQASPLTQVAVCRLELTPKVPEQPGGTVVWDPSRRQGELLITRLKPPADGHDYQLWVVEDGRKDAVSAGVVHVDAEGNARVEFKPEEPGGNQVQAFAVSLEKAGGSETNQGPIVLTGKF